MTEIHVLIKGIIMFVSSTVYGVSDHNTGAAIAVHASAHSGKYDVMLPDHKAKLFIPIANVDPSVPPLPDIDGTSYVITLNGARVQLGKYSNGKCGELTGVGPSGNLSNNNDVPDVKVLTAVTRLNDDSRPTSGGIYDGIDLNHVAAWLNMNAGSVDVVATATPTMAEFRPKTNIKYTPVASVKWTAKIISPCVMITPFRGGSPSPTMVRLTNDPLIELRFENLPVPPPGGHSHGRLGASYDFELLYDLLDAQPAIPPIPHHLLPDPAAVGQNAFLGECFQTCNTQSKGTTDPVSGLNCGPGNNTDPGNPKP